MDFFPIGKTPRAGQKVVINSAVEAFEAGFKNIVIEAPVGSGKSAIAVALSHYIGTSHILTPRKSLQTQYEDDFPTELIGMRGRSFYPCVEGGKNCADCPLLQASNRSLLRKDADAVADEYRSAYARCRDLYCPYTQAIKEANEHSIVVHNYHSFIFQASLFDKFPKRDVIIFDEAHEIPNILRSFGEITLTFVKAWMPDNYVVPPAEELNGEIIKDMALHLYDVAVREELGDKVLNELSEMLTRLEALADYLTEDNYVFSVENNIMTGKVVMKMTPIKVGPLCHNMLYRLGDVRIFLSGTIFSPEMFCQYAGLKLSETAFLQMKSTFPVQNRPVYNRPDLQVNTSFAQWDENFTEIIAQIKKSFNIFHDVKGLIHAPSYRAAAELMAALADTGRVMTHTGEDLEKRLAEFYASKDNKVFISPSCQQGVDMKYDRAKFQIILRVPYPNTSDAFIAKMMKDNFSWYNYQALITFGQQLGRVVRAEDDFGATILLDSRFPQFINRNRHLIPKWVLESIR